MANYTNSNMAAQGLFAGQSITGPGNTVSGVAAQSVQTINLGSLSGLSGSSVTLSSIDDIMWDNNHVKKYQVLEIEEDLLVLSCAWKRLREEHNNGGAYSGISKLIDKELFKKVTDIDHTMATEIRDFYSKKIVMWKLKGQKLSNFREDMNSFIHSNGKVFKEDMCPLVYRLPEFYEYDIAFQNLSDEHSKIITEPIKGKVQKVLKFAKKLAVNRKHSKIMEYWFADENNNLVKLGFAQDNTLLSLLDKCAYQDITISGYYTKRIRDNVEYWIADKIKFV